MKKKVILITLCAIAIVGASSCRGAAGKRAATEAAEFLEKKGGSLLEREGSRAVEEEESNAMKYYKNKRRAEKIRDYIDDMTEDDESQYQPQPVSVICGQCGGSGAVYLLDAYGNVMVDYYGTPQVSMCPVCSGTGQQIVYQ